MKQLIILFCLVCSLFSCDIRNEGADVDLSVTKNTEPIKDSTTVQMIDSSYDFGKVTDGENVTFSYRFRNTGSKPLVISSATASCGCTVPEKPEEPIKPGEIGYLKIVFNSKGRVGPVHKTVHVVSNASPAIPVLQLTGEVESAKK